MIQEISIHNIATYGKPVSMRPLSINFIYGSNGSGKSALANFLQGEISSAESNIVWKNNSPLQVLVYNKSFVEATFGTSSPISGVFTLGEDSKEAQEFITQKRDDEKACGNLIDMQTSSISILKQKQAALDSNLDETCWAFQQKYGVEFSEALVGYRGSKRSFRDKCLQEYSNLNATPLPELQEIKDLYRTAYGEKRDEYPLFPEIEEAAVKQQEECPLLTQRISGSSETPVGKFIEFLNNSDWVKQGIEYTKKADGKCPYCQQTLSHSIQQDIEAFFNETYEKECAAVRAYQIQYDAFTKTLFSKLRSIYDNPIHILDYALFKSEVDVLGTAIEVNKKTIQDKVNSPSTLVRIDIVLCAVNIFHNKKKPYITVVIFAILLSISMPFIINEAYKAGTGYITMWRAEDVLAFYGTILGAVATIIAVILTIVYMNKQNRKTQEYQRRLILADMNKIELKKEFDEKQKEYRSSTENINQRLQITLKKKDIEKLPYERFEKPVTESENDIWTKYNKTLFSYRDEYKSDYMDVYNGFLDCKKKRLKTDIEELYNFKENK